ncbi:glucokinase [Suhomyces tanzawaensis NRRL Y-17324]|uniref:Gluconokinase n=1 Tax=Suhomyces tanzawaensis NRRL Y-17324 TaxID=984487 RepID=A0A1E4SK47_9ASCO|nr:glucokinase [Suhomyces tanzawaensis NRRL Y-17324]ODV79802.1 glucokinase [Suhomyces tanzawaensis NRRL Y-17324]
MPAADKHTIVVVGGPAGTGKTTVGEILAAQMACPFVEGDILHPKANIDKMSQGIALTDDDRWGWLEKLSVIAAEKSKEPENASHTSVVTCSMLKKLYRQHIKDSAQTTCRFIFLYSLYELLLERVGGRSGHFMKADMVKSQFDIMEVPEGPELVENGGDCVAIEIAGKSPEQLYNEIVEKLK